MSVTNHDRQVLNELVQLSNVLGDPGLDYVILGEGNTSARIDGESFWVKASGTRLAEMGEEHFVKMSFAGLQELLGRTGLGDDAIRDGLLAARLGEGEAQHPSVETLMHALCLEQPGVDYVGHSHPTAINAITCSEAWPGPFWGGSFPTRSSSVDRRPC